MNQTSVYIHPLRFEPPSYLPPHPSPPAIYICDSSLFVHHFKICKLRHIIDPYTVDEAQ